MARIILHLPERLHQTYQSRDDMLYKRIEDHLGPRGAQIVLQTRPPKDARMADGDLHIVDNGRVNAPGYLNACTAYLKGFWHLDPQGVLAESGIAALPYDPDLVDKPAADAFAARIRARFAGARQSRYRQPRAREALPEGAIAVFLQGPSPQNLGHAHCTVAEMLAAVAMGAQGRTVLVKPHPLKPDLGRAQIAAACARGHALVATDANVHDILACAAVTVSINSAVALEGFQHGKPAILFGKSDFHHFVETVRAPEAFPAALRAALARRDDHARALYWYFGQHCLWLDAPDFEARLLAIFARAGFDAPRLGLRA